MDFQNLLRKVVPWIGAAATGNVPALVAMAAKEVSDVLGIEVPPTSEAIGTAVANATPEQATALRMREMDFKERMQAMGFQHERELANIALEETKVFVTDTADARKAHAGDNHVYRLAIAIMITFTAVMMACLYGCYALLTGGIVVKDVNTVAAVFGLLGSIMGYVTANAQQVSSFYFGSSKGSKEKTDALANAVRDFNSTTMKTSK